MALCPTSRGRPEAAPATGFPTVRASVGTWTRYDGTSLDLYQHGARYSGADPRVRVVVSKG
ncbi:hypothetical protein, partial [Streptomyces sp. NPDC058766]|uniref:hypothetical protein n=1 Tax=Streptomyces sp. NPDC058766 TaxID=3346630 RepID=UPI0036CD01EF